MSSLLDNAQSTLVNTFSGADQLQDEASITAPSALALQNCEFLGNSVITRRGFGVAYAAALGITSMWDWFQEAQNYLVYLNPGASGGPKASWINLENTSLTGDIVTGLASAVGMTNAALGFREMMTFFNSSGVGSEQCYVWDGTYYDATSNAEPMFPHAPVLSAQVNAFTFANSGAPTAPAIGVTAGLHYFALVVTTYNGLQGPPGPIDSSSNFLPQPFTAAGGQALTITIPPATTWPINYNTIQIAMTPVNNPNNWYIVPGTITGVPRGGSFSVNIQIEIDDISLADEAQNITSTLFTLYTQNPDGTGPFNPHFVLPYGNRMVYGCRLPTVSNVGTVQGALFASEINNPNYITLQYHLLQLPEFRDVATAGVLNDVLYVFGGDWTYAFSDNTQYPVQWAPCTTVSANIGSPFIKGVTVNIARNIMWVCAKGGLFAFNGNAYDNQPSSYIQGAADWSSINWAAPANTLQVVDYPDKRIVVVMAPVGSSQTTANYMLVWDYSQGYDAASIRYCGMWWINGSGGQLTLGAIANVHSVAQNVEELWVGMQVADNIYRQKYIPADASANPATSPTALYNDNTYGIDSKYRPASPMAADAPVYQQLGVMLRIRGAGSATVNAYSLDQTNEITTIAPVTLAWQPGKTYLRLYDKQAQASNIEITNQATAGQFFWLSAIRYFFQPWLQQGNS
jgi:hypothetical protein